jgi:hypothetical protein
MKQELDRVNDLAERLRSLISDAEHVRDLNRRILRLEAALEQSQKNDTPKHPDTGKFIKRPK